MTADYQRAVEIDAKVDSKSRPWSLGSGYRISEHLILSCAHTFRLSDSDEIQQNIRVRDVTGNPLGRVHYCWHDFEADLSLWSVETPVRPPHEQLAPVRFATLPVGRADELPFWMYGWPRFAALSHKDRTVTRKGSDESGIIKLSEYHSALHKTGTIPLLPQSTPTSERGSWWSGMSGASVFCFDHLVGVHVSALNPEAGLIVEASPIAPLFAEERPLSYLTAAGVRTSLDRLTVGGDMTSARHGAIAAPNPLTNVSKDMQFDSSDELSDSDRREAHMIAEIVSRLTSMRTTEPLNSCAMPHRPSVSVRLSHRSGRCLIRSTSYSRQETQRGSNYTSRDGRRQEWSPRETELTRLP